MLNTAWKGIFKQWKSAANVDSVVYNKTAEVQTYDLFTLYSALPGTYQICSNYEFVVNEMF